MLSHIVSRFPVEGCRSNNYLASCLRFFSKKRIVVDEAFRPKAKPKPNAVQLNPYNKIRYVAKQSLLPQSHVLKALCVKEGKYYYLTDENGMKHCFTDEKNIVVSYPVAEAYLNRCKKECECVEIDPENIQDDIKPNCKMIKKRSVISVVGEMDHGKTTLLDSFLHTHYQKQEFGGTTQVIRGNEFTLTDDTTSQPCTFLDTPGQSCFSYIRENGSILSDLTLYVISLYEGPSDEAHHIFQQLKENGVPVFALFTKTDLVSKERRDQVINQVYQLAKEYDVTLVDSQAISSVTGEGLPELKHKLIHHAQSLQREVPLSVPAEASILDSSLIPSQGIVFKALIQQGVLSVRDPFICGLYTGNVRSLVNLQSKSVQKAYPGMVVHVLGARKLPPLLRKTNKMLPAGDTLFVRKPDEIEKIWDQRLLEQLFRSSLCDQPEEEVLTGNTEMIDGDEYMEVKVQSVIVIADNANSMNILMDEVGSIPGVQIVRTRIGQITTSDVEECRDSNVRLISFNVPLPEKMRLSPKKFIYSRIISDLIAEVKEQFE